MKEANIADELLSESWKEEEGKRYGEEVGVGGRVRGRRRRVSDRGRLRW